MPADLHTLEIAFAKNPSLEACLHLCRAYLEAKRYMEATVVCKKGVKLAPPADPRGRIMLARILLAQARPQKAQAEATTLLADFPQNAAALEILGRAHLDQGRRDEGVAALRAALRLDAGLGDAAQALAQLGEVLPADAAPTAATAVTPVFVPEPVPLTASAARSATAVTPSPAPAADGQPPDVVPSWHGVEPQGLGHASGAVAAAGGDSTAPRPAVDVGTPVPDLSAAVRSRPGQPVEHVDDFFAPTALGFTSDGSNIETAGPGRLTILGFVPRSSGSLKVTLSVFVAVVVALGTFYLYQAHQAGQQRLIASKFAGIRRAFEDDQVVGYHRALTLGDDILAIAPSHPLTLSAMAYAQAVLAIDHHVQQAQARAQAWLALLAQHPGEENEFAVAARAIVAGLSGEGARGLSDILSILKKGGSSPIVEMEAHRLMAAMQPDDKQIQLQLRRVTASVVGQARVLNYLGWLAFDDGAYARASKTFEQVLQNVKSHPAAKMGRAWVALERAEKVGDFQKQIDADVADVLATPAQAQSPATQAQALWARAGLRRWQKDTARATQDLLAAHAADPKSTGLDYHSGLMLLHMGQPAEAATALATAVGEASRDVRALKYLAQAQTGAKMFGASHATLERAQNLWPQDRELQLLAADLWSAQGDWPHALTAYRTLAGTASELATQLRAQLGIGVALTASAPQEAITYLEKVLTDLPADSAGTAQARVLCQLGRAYAVTDNRAKAAQSYAFGIEKDAAAAECHFYQCKLLGAVPSGRRACQAYLDLAPYGPYAAEATATASATAMAD